NGDRVRIALNALEPLEDVLMVTTGGPPGEDGYRLEPVLLQERLRLEPMAVFEREIPAPAPEQPLVVRLGGEELWSEEPVGEDFARPVRAPEGRRADTASRTCLLAR